MVYVRHIFFASVSWFSLSTHRTMHCLKCLFNMDNHIDLVRSGTFVERISRQNCTSEYIKKSLDFFFDLVGNFNMSDIFFCKCFVILTFSQKQLFTHRTMRCLKCLFHMNNHLNLFGSVTFVERISRRNGTSENICKLKRHLIFLVFCRRF